MARPLRPLDPGAGPIQSFAARLRALRTAAGEPKYLQMARKTGKSRTALAEAAGGDHLPTWETVAAFVTACQGDAAEWRISWEQVRDEVRRNPERAIGHTDPAPHVAPNVDDPPDHTSLATHDTEATEQTHRSRLSRRLLICGGAIAISGLGIGISHLVMREPASAATVITVQNMVALGQHELVEDQTPAYLSDRPVPRCAANGCQMAGSEMATGAMVVAVCTVDGVKMFNYNLDSPESRRNPAKVASALWYRVVLPNGTSGYLSEVYIRPADRGGAGLGRCG